MSLLANSNAIETGGYQISRSVRLRSSASAYFNRTPASAATSRRIMTLSFWCKRGILGSSKGLYWGGASVSDGEYLSFNSTDYLEWSAQINGGSSYGVRTVAVFRDPSAWYHIFVAIDTTQATDTNRVKIYINNVLQTLTTFYSGYPPQNTDLEWNNQSSAQFFPDTSSHTAYFDGYIAEAYMIDGQALTPSSFGETDTITGSWVAKKYTGTYGTNGFYLNFSDNSAATSTTIGKDYSGNGNNWTPNNISVTAGSTYDSMLDVPSGNGYADGGNGRGNYAALNPLEYYLNSPTNGNLDAYSATNNSNQVSTFALPNSGKWYWEVTRTETDSTSAFSWMVGVVKTDTNKAVTTYSNANAYVYYSWDGSKYTAGSNSAYGASWRTNGDVIGCAWDADGQTLTFYKNNVSQGTAFSSLNYANGYMMIVSRTGGATASTLVTNFGQRPFSYTPPTGFKALNTTNLPTPTIGATSTTQANDYFDISLYTGTGSSLSITGLQFQPDWVWIKGRSGATDHGLYDAVRGVQKQLESNTTTAETTETTGLTAFNSDGFTVGALAQLNTSTATYVAWNWKANGAGSTNTAGSITSTVSANTTSGFSIVTYTGNNTSGATVGHGLGVKPAFIIVKKRTGTDGWGIYHTSLGATKTMELNTTAAEAASAIPWNNTEPTSSVIYLNGNNYANSSLYTYVMYVFTAVAGYSAFGSYTGNGSTDGPFVFCGFRPAYILIKSSTDGTTNWLISDNKRLGYNITSNQLKANTSAAEESFAGGWHIDFVSNGFKVRNTYANMNGSGATYIYAAFAESPLKFSNAR